jgi:IS4 transposase
MNSPLNKSNAKYVICQYLTGNKGFFYILNDKNESEEDAVKNSSGKVICKIIGYANEGYDVWPIIDQYKKTFENT